MWKRGNSRDRSELSRTETQYSRLSRATRGKDTNNYHYHYAYMPYARVVERNGGYELEVDGMSDGVEVVKVR